MITISIHLREDDLLEKLEVTGHAKSDSNGYSVACAAVSTLTRTAARILVEHNGIEVDLQVPEPGNFFLLVKEIPFSEAQWLLGVSQFILFGIKDLNQDYPDEIDLKIL